jgi:hypothetical protein
MPRYEQHLKILETAQESMYCVTNSVAVRKGKLYHAIGTLRQDLGLVLIYIR